MHFLIDTRACKGDKDSAECVVPQRPHVIEYFDGAGRQRKGAGGFMIYRLEE